MPDSETPSGETPAEPTPPETTPSPEEMSTDAPTGETAPGAHASPTSDATTDATAPQVSPTDGAATAPVADTTPVPVAGSPVAGSPAAAPRSSHIMVPRWAAFAVAGLLLVGAGFGAGWFLNDGDDDSSAAIQRPERPTQDDSRPFGDPEVPRFESTTFLGVSTAPTDDDSGVRIAAVLDASPADDAGLEADDVILEVDGEAVGTPGELVAAIRSLDPGDEVTITYERDGEEDSVDVTLTERDDSSANLRPS